MFGMVPLCARPGKFPKSPAGPIVATGSMFYPPPPRPPAFKLLCTIGTATYKWPPK